MYINKNASNDIMNEIDGVDIFNSSILFYIDRINQNKFNLNSVTRLDLIANQISSINQDLIMGLVAVENRGLDLDSIDKSDVINYITPDSYTNLKLKLIGESK